MESSLLSRIPRVRFTTHLPIDDTRIGFTVWVGSRDRGWRGKTLRRGMFRGMTWKLGYLDPAILDPDADHAEK